MINRISPLAAALALVLAGCAVGPDYQRPASSLPKAYQESADPASTIDREWWHAFNDAELNALVERALKDSTDVRIAIAKVEQADAVMRQAGAALFPEFDLDASANRGHISQLTANPPSSSTLLTTNSFRLALSTSFELDFWGKLRRARESALASAEASRYSRDTVRLTLVSQVASAYIGLRSNDALLTATQATLKTREEAFKIAKRRYDSGKQLAAGSGAGQHQSGQRTSPVRDPDPSARAEREPARTAGRRSGAGARKRNARFAAASSDCIPGPAREPARRASRCASG